MTRLVSAVAGVLTGAVGAARAQRGQPLPPTMFKEGVTQKIADHVDTEAQ